VWQYEGDYTLYDLMQKKDFPYNLEPLLLGRELDMPKGPRRKSITIQIVMEQILQALKACHSTGIVHRDIKPQNVIISQTDNKAKLIDLGAAADLRVGINYVPNEFLLDPRYAPPQQYIMSTQTPRAPPLPVAALLSPILWRLNSPDRFDMYSVGILFLQMVFPNLRSDNNLVAFNRKLQAFDYDVRAWRRSVQKRNSGAGSRDYQEGFEILSLNNGAAWDLLCSLVAFEPSKRLSAAAALRHRWFGGGVFGTVATAVDKVGSTVGQVLSGDEWIGDALAKSGTQRTGGLTEAELAEELADVMDMPPGLRNASNTIVWWRQRQAVLDNKASSKKLKRALNSLQKNASRTISEGRRKGFKLFSSGHTTS
jgi:serine/threonine protein kinase